MSKTTQFILPSKNRMLSLDILRGITIASMIIVNDPGSWSSIYPMLRHADWHGITPTDLVFPFFLFIVGVSISLSYTKQLKANISKKIIIRKIFKRTAIIFLLGIFLWLFPKFDFSAIRIPGVLQRIALVFGASSLLFLYLNQWKQQALLVSILLIGYWLMMTFIPVPIDEVIAEVLQSGEIKAQAGLIGITVPTVVNETFVTANLEPGTNLAAWVDRMAIPFRLWQYTWDPEGLLSTIPSIGTTATGILIGKLWMSKIKIEKRIIWIFVIGLFWFILGALWHYSFPINKNLWSSSYVLFTSGICTMLFAACIWLVDMNGYHRFTFPFIVFGTNAIAAYMLHSMLSSPTMPIKIVVFDFLKNIGCSPNLASLGWALLYTWLIYIIVWVMYKRKIFLKI